MELKTFPEWEEIVRALIRRVFNAERVHEHPALMPPARRRKLKRS